MEQRDGEQSEARLEEDDKEWEKTKEGEEGEERVTVIECKRAKA